MQRIDKYEVLEEIGRGGMGAVYKAFHPHLKKYVAIKEIRADLAPDPELASRFAREAELLAQLPAHPNIVTVRDALNRDGRLYLVMDYIEGGSLADVIARGAVEPGRGGEWLDQILSALAVIHQRQIVHRDLKPGNVLLDAEGTAYVTDFGIAESTGQAVAATPMGTAKYLAPELADAALKRGGTERQADLYAIGMMAYEMFLGAARFKQVFAPIYRHPAAETGRAWLDWHVDLARPATPLNQIDARIPPPLSAVVARLMAKDVNERYREASEARRDLQAALTTLPVKSMNNYQDDATVPLSQLQRTSPSQPTPPSQPPARGGRAARLPGWAKWAGAGAALLLLLSVVILARPKPAGFTIVVKGATPDAITPDTEVYVGDAKRGILGIGGGNRAAADAFSLINVFGLKSDGKYPVRVMKGGADATLYRNGQPVSGELTGQDGETVELVAKWDGTSAPSGRIDLNGPMALVRGGEFILGDDSAPKEWNAGPAHKVFVDDFYIDEHEVTVAQFQQAGCGPLPATPGFGPDRNNLTLDPAYFKNPNSPVLGLSWSEAKSCAEKMGKRLPTEAEWEKAATWDPKADPKDAAAKWKRKYVWGNAPIQGAEDLSLTRPVSVDAYQADVSAYGIKGLAWNVSEWVLSSFRPYPITNQTEDDGNAQAERVARGGYFRSPAEATQPTLRIHLPPNVKNVERDPSGRIITTNIGFRTVISAKEAQRRGLIGSPAGVQAGRK